MDKSILLVDDEEGIRKVLSIALSDQGYQVHTAANGVEARAAVLAHVGELLVGQREVGDVVGDVVGRLGEGVFGVIMTASDPATAEPRVKALVDKLRRRPPLFRGRVMTVRLGVGLHALERGERVESVLAAAEAARRSDGGPP